MKGDSKGPFLCEYNAIYSRGKPPAIETARIAKRSDGLRTLSSESFNTSNTPNGAGGGFQPVNMSPLLPRGRSAEYPRYEERYASASVANQFGSRASANHNPNASVGSFGDAPSYASNTSIFLLPSEIAQEMVEIYFSMASPAIRILHRSTVNKWIDEMYHYDHLRDTQDDHSRRAVILMIFAEAAPHLKSRHEEDRGVDRR